MCLYYKTVGLLIKKFQNGCEFCIIQVQRNNFRGETIEKKIVFPVFYEIRQEIFSSVVKTEILFPEDHFGGKYSF